MPDISLVPFMGMNNAAEDAALLRQGDSPAHFVRDAVNVNFTDAGKLELRAAPQLVSATAFKNLWQSPLHRDVFATLGDRWVRVDSTSWEHVELAAIGEGSVSHDVLGNRVCVAAPAGIYCYDGAAALPLSLDTPPAPMAWAGAGAMEPGKYGAAVAWLRGELESAPSDIVFTELAETGGLSLVLPTPMDTTVTGIRLYLTRLNGGELLRAGDYALSAPQVTIALLPELGRAAQFMNLSPMPTGRWLRYWRGRLLTARANVLRWSEAMAYHLHDERHGFIMLPQRITFIEPVEGGVWVGQVDHVVFLQGSSPSEFTVQRKAAKAPIAGSSLQLSAEDVGAELAAGGTSVAAWLAENGYVIGTASGSLVELHAGVMRGIAGESAHSVVLEGRLLSAVV